MRRSVIVLCHATGFMIAVATVPWALAAHAQCVVPRIHQGMPYAQARRVILKAGFETPQPKSGRTCPDADTCKAFPEIQSCSREDYCAMRFSNPRADKLDVFVYGDIKTGSVDVEDYRIVCGTSTGPETGRHRELRR